MTERKEQERDRLIDEAVRLLNEGFHELSLKCTVEMLREQNRTSERVYLRRLACRMLRAQGFTLTQIGRVIERNHCTVLNLLNRTGYEDSPQTHEQLMVIKRASVAQMIEYHQKRIGVLRAKLQGR